MLVPKKKFLRLYSKYLDSKNSKDNEKSAANKHNVPDWFQG